MLIPGMLMCLLHEARPQDIVAGYQGPDETVSQLLFTSDAAGFGMQNAYRARNSDLYDSHAGLTVSGDFTGDGLDEIAFFEDVLYDPNMNPGFICSAVRITRSLGDRFLPAGSWFSVPETTLDFDHVDFAAAADYNQDGLCDIALFYNDPGSEQLFIYVLESEGTAFSDASVWYSCQRNDFNFTALSFVCAEDFNGNGQTDLAVFYDYFGTSPDTKQSIFLFESDGTGFSLLPAAYDATRESYDFSLMKHAMPGDFNRDGYADIALIYDDPVRQDLVIPVFEGSAGGQLSPVAYGSFSETGPDPAHILHALGGQFAGDTASDLALFYDNPVSGNQEILVFQSEAGSFKSPEISYSTDAGELDIKAIFSVHHGNFFYQPVVRVSTWKDDRQGAVSFTFDDGYRGAFEHGAAELEAAGLKGTFYIFTDTLSVYDGELASTSLVRTYKELGHEIASHTANHANLGLLTESGNMDSINQVLSTSLELLNERFDQYTMTMSIPFGSFRYGTLEQISEYFYSARSSQHGFNLATPYDFHALKSWPVLSTTSPAYVDNLLSITEQYGTYLPLMYHDMLDEPFDVDLMIYTYSRELFRETVQAARSRDLWIDTHERVYKYIRERNALRILELDLSELDQEGGNLSFIADDGLADSIFNVAVTLKILLPQSWKGDTITVGPEGGYSHLEVQQDVTAQRFILFDWLPVSDIPIYVHDGIIPTTGISDRNVFDSRVNIKAYPNPFDQETRIRVSDNLLSNSYLIVRDIHGRIMCELREQSGDSFVLSGASLNPGIYLVQLIRDGRPLTSLKLLAL